MRKYIKENKFYLGIILLIVVLFQIRLPFYVNAPGGTIDIGDRISMEEEKELNGSLNLLYVSEYVATVPIYLLSYVIPNWDLESIKGSQISNENEKEIDIRNKVMLDNSINNALYVAYREADKKIEVVNKHNIVVGTTVNNGFKIGDEIKEIDNRKIKDLEDIKEILRNKEVGDKVSVKLIHQDKEKELSVDISDIDGNSGLGIVVVSNYEFETDPDIELKFKSSESGASGGLMLSLSIYSAISGTDILKGRDIAGTGTIDMNGNVGAIAGIKYKIMGAVKNKMDVVLVPADNYEEALEVVRDKKYDIELVRVETFHDAIEYLENS